MKVHVTILSLEGILSYPILLHPILLHPILLHPIFLYPILLYPILLHPVISNFILSRRTSHIVENSIFVSLHLSTYFSYSLPQKIFSHI